MKHKIKKKLFIWIMIFTIIFTISVKAETDYFTNYHGDDVYYEIKEKDGVYTLTVLSNEDIQVTNENLYEALNELEELYQTTVTIPRLAREGNIKALEFLNFDLNISEESEEGFNRSMLKLKALFDKLEIPIFSLLLTFAFIDFIWLLTKAKGIADNPQIKKDFYMGVFGLFSFGLFLSAYGIIKIMLANWINNLLIKNGYLSIESKLGLVNNELKLVAVGLIGIGILTSMLFFYINFLKLGAVASNPKERAKALKGVLINGITTAILGSAMFWFIFALNVFQ